MHLSKPKLRIEKYLKLTCIPKINPSICKKFRKYSVKVAFKSWSSLSDILCQHKCPLPENSHPGVYKLECNYSSIYMGETKKKINKVDST